MFNRDLYFTLRAQKEHQLAERCKDPAIAITHRRLAWEYERKIQEADMSLRVVMDA